MEQQTGLGLGIGVRGCVLAVVLCFAGLNGACDGDTPRDGVIGDQWNPSEHDAGHDDASAGAAGTGGAGGSSGSCIPAVASEHLPAREAVMSTGGLSENAGVFTSELYGQFVDHCGSCHTQGRNQGGFDVSRGTFVEKITDEVLMRARSEDPMVVMPPNSLPFSMRDPNAPIVKFVERLGQWFAAGKPADVFYPDDGEAVDTGVSPYVLSKAVGMGMTNLGNCVPDKAMAMTGIERAMKLDRDFEAMESFADLPKSLRDTDLFTLDGAELARHGVLAFAPAYTLWADNAKKVRHIRVPVGTSVRFDPTTQSFDIPVNSRLYKTFLKAVTDIQGNARYRKMETRLIVSRPDRVLPDGKHEPTALFASYKWNDAETEATLHEVHYRDGTGFTDDIRVYVVDERIEDQIVRSAPADLDTALLEAGARRSYPIPGADRCVNCHMGRDGFVLGFTPLQINRRPLGEGGVVEPAAAHELDQLQRLIAYGLITGMESPAQVTPLERSQPNRAPRNEHELKAQGYMLGNCAHCHNPNGFPSQREAVLRDTLNFLPGERGGIFQFPLDKMSARTFRGTSQDIRIPYITPSLFDNPLAVQSNDDNTGAIKRSNKWIERVNPTAGEIAANAELAERFPAFEAMALNPGRPLLAPWRSLIYRNVDAPFSYEDGGTIFPRMPMETPGYDCRARRLLGTWMVSIPARRAPLMSVPPGLEQYEELSGTEEQPYVEVRPDEPDYPEFQALALARLEQFQRSERFQDCPPPELDGVAPEVSSGRSVLPNPQLSFASPDSSGNPTEVYDLLSPARPHYPKTDLHDDPSWVIRRPDWVDVLHEDRVDPVKEAVGGAIALASRQTIDAVNQIQIDDEAEAFLLGERPFGLWRNKPECATKLGAQPKVADFTGDARPSWMTLTQAPDDAAVYMISPGAQVFDMICSRCHGPEATGKSALAGTIGDLTGGLTRVANLRDGLFGPAIAPGMNWMTQFGVAADQDVDAREWGARYVAWMGLGGTNAQIPATVLTKLRSSEVLGSTPQTTRFKPNPADAANMLTVAKLACEVFYPAFNLTFDPATGRFVRQSNDPNDNGTLARQGLITDNGVAELWEALCHFHNPGPVRAVEVNLLSVDKVLYVNPAADLTSPDSQSQPYRNIFDRSRYPADARVGDQNGAITVGIQPDNLAPWCFKPVVPGSYKAEDQQEAYQAAAARLGLAVDQLPWCPAQATDPAGRRTVADGSRWAIAGATNAGVAVFLYLDALAHGRLRPKPAYDRCEELP